jgi:metal-dependent amidase/aminoacylase/carboxypeptidase family protein
VIKKGGEQANIIPEDTELEYYLRAPSDLDLQLLRTKVSSCIQAAAMATGCSVSYGLYGDGMLGKLWSLW